MKLPLKEAFRHAKLREKIYWRRHRNFDLARRLSDIEILNYVARNGSRRIRKLDVKVMLEDRLLETVCHHFARLHQHKL